MTVRSLLERGEELAELDAAIEAVTDGDGRLLLVEGPAGAGKSALLQAARGIAASAGLRVLRARGSELERELAFGVVEQALAPLGATVPPAADPGGALVAVHGILTDAAAGGALLLTVDDAHWADPSSLRALSYVAGRLTGLPLVLLVALRAGEPGGPEDLLDRLRHEPAVTRVAPAALTPDGVCGMVRARFPHAGDDACAAVHAVTAGNPLLVEETLRVIASDGRLAAADPVREVETVSVPLLGERLARRMSPEGEDAPALARAMAVLGEGRLADAAAIAGLPLERAGELAHRLERIEVLAAQDPFSFVHPLLRRSIYDGWPATERAAAHRRAADLLRRRGAPAQAVACHLAVLPPEGDEETAATLLAAGEAALAGAAPAEAVHWLDRALAEASPAPPRAVLLARLGAAEAALRDPAATAHLREAYDATTDPSGRAALAGGLAQAHLLAGRWDLALEVTAEARETVPGHDAELAAIEVFVMAYTRDRVAELDERRPEMAALTEGEGWAPAALAAVLAAVAAHRGDDLETARALADRALAGSVAAARPEAAWSGAHLLIALIALEDLPAALAQAEAMRTAAERAGSLAGMLTAVDHLAWAHARAGDLAAAEADLRVSLALAEAGESPTAAGSQAFYCLDALLERPELDDVAERMLALELGPGLEGTWISAALLSGRGRLRAARRDTPGAVADLRASLAAHEALRMSPTVSPARSALALALPASERDEALALVEEELALARRIGLARPLGIALRSAGTLAGGAEGIAYLREAADVLAGSPARLEAARARVVLGAALRRAGVRLEARTELAAGLELAVRCGATRLAAHARDELAAAGGRPRRVATSGPESLTASERRVAELAAGGASNTEIARELFVGLKTVETHLSHAYHKLGIGGPGARARLAAVLAPAG